MVMPRSYRSVSLLVMLMAVSFLHGFGPRAWAMEIEGVTFSDTYRTGSLTMSIHGVGLAKFLRTIKVYAGALYLEPGVRPDMVLGDVPKRLELSYFRALKGGDFGEAANKVLSDNVSQDTIERLTPQIERLHRLYQDVKPGDRYGLTYVPGIGTELALNGERKGIIEGADFAAAYFAIWLGPDPISAALKEGLLNRR